MKLLVCWQCNWDLILVLSTGQLLATAGHVALYDFDVSNKKWSRKDVEGSLFVYKRRGLPRFRFTILNKKSADNFVEDISGGFQTELNPPYLLYRSPSLGSVVGMWFYDQEDCSRISSLLQKISSTFAAPSDAEAGLVEQTATAPPPPQQQQQQQQQQHAKAPAPSEASSSASSGKAKGGDFWDKEVEVPLNLPAPGSRHASLQQMESTASSSVMAQLFSGMRVTNGVDSSPPVVSAPAAMVPLLTPEYLAKATSSVPQPSETPQPAVSGTMLFKLMGGVSKGESTMPFNADSRVDSKVSSLLHGLADNKEFCNLLAKEMEKAGLA